MSVFTGTPVETIARQAKRYVVARMIAGLALVAALMNWSPLTQAQPFVGRLDRSFSGDGSSVARFATRSFRGASVAQAIGTFQNGKVILAGRTWDVGWGDTFFPGRLSVARFLNDGRPDPTFGNGDGLASYLSNKLESVWVSDLALYADGKILVTGDVSNKGGFVVRLLPDGNPDLTFGVGGVVELTSDGIHNLDIDHDGKILVVGAGFLSRLNSDGSRDSTFKDQRYGEAGKISTGLYNHPTVRLLNNGKILIAGHLISARGPLVVARRNADGSRDLSFGTGGKVELPGRWYGVVGLELLDSGEAIVVGHWVVQQGSHERAIGLVRVTADGRVDDRFNQAQPVTWSSPRGLPPVKTEAFSCAKHRGGILVLGATGHGMDALSEMFVVKFDRDGRFMGEFYMPQTVARSFYGYAISVRGLDQKVLVAGFARTERVRWVQWGQNRSRLWPHFAALRFNEDPPPTAVRGSIDRRFTPRPLR